MNKTRMEAFSDGMIAIFITVMVLEMKVPHAPDLASLAPLVPVFLTYVLSYIYLGIYWNNHHHMLHATRLVTGAVLWANLHLLFWLSLIPFTTGWMGENHFTPIPTAAYGVVLFMSAVAYWGLQQTIIRQHGAGELLQRAVGTDWKGKLSPVLYLTAIVLAFAWPPVSLAIYVAVALLWLVPDRRIERVLIAEERGPPASP